MLIRLHQLSPNLFNNNLAEFVFRVKRSTYTLFPNNDIYTIMVNLQDPTFGYYGVPGSVVLPGQQPQPRQGSVAGVHAPLNHTGPRPIHNCGESAAIYGQNNLNPQASQIPINTRRQYIGITFQFPNHSFDNGFVKAPCPNCSSWLLEGGAWSMRPINHGNRRGPYTQYRGILGCVVEQDKQPQQYCFTDGYSDRTSAGSQRTNDRAMKPIDSFLIDDAWYGRANFRI